MIHRPMNETEEERLLAADTLAALQQEVACCRRCNAAGYDVAHSPVMGGLAAVPMVLVGQSPASPQGTPGGLPFSGRAGRRLFQWLAGVGWEEEAFRQHCYITAITKCYPGAGTNGKGDRAPTRREQQWCRSFLARELAIIRPQVVIPLGRIAIEFFLGRIGPLDQVIGRTVVLSEDSPAPGACLIPLPHPSGASLWLNKPANQALVTQALEHLRSLRDQQISITHTKERV